MERMCRAEQEIVSITAVIDDNLNPKSVRLSEGPVPSSTPAVLALVLNHPHKTVTVCLVHTLQ